MRVVIYSHTAFFETSLSLAAALAERAEVHLLIEVSPSAWHTAFFDVPALPIAPGIMPADELLAPYFPAAVRRLWQRLTSFRLVVHSSRRSLSPQSWRLSRRVLGFVTSLAPDIFHIDGVDISGRLTIALPGWSGPPIVVSCHDPTPHSGEEGGWRQRLARRLAFPRASAFIVHAEGLENTFPARDHVPLDRIHVVHLGVFEIARAWMTTNLKDGIDDDDHGLAPAAGSTVLFFGRQSPYKGLDVLYSAVPGVAASLPGVQFVVAGRPITGYHPPAPPEAHRGHVEVLEGRISNARLAELLEAATVVVCPYRDATQSGVVLTAFAFRRPVVASDVGGLRDYVLPDRTGTLVPPGDAAALAAALVQMLTDAPFRERLVAGIATEAEGRLSWSQSARDLLDIYRKVVST